MKSNQVKLPVIAFFALALFALTITKIGKARAVSDSQQIPTNFRADAAATYKAKCSVCHSPKADKFFDAAKTDEALVEVILKGKKAAKPPHMPEYASQGMTADQARDLVVYMRKLKNPEAVTPESKDAQDPKARAKEVTKEKAREAIIAQYKTSCAACHGAGAEKSFSPEMKEADQVQIILKGKKGAKPPFMPGFESKGVTTQQAAALSAYMIELRTPDK